MPWLRDLAYILLTRNPVDFVPHFTLKSMLIQSQLVQFSHNSSIWYFFLIHVHFKSHTMFHFKTSSFPRLLSSNFIHDCILNCLETCTFLCKPWFIPIHLNFNPQTKHKLLKSFQCIPNFQTILNHVHYKQHKSISFLFSFFFIMITYSSCQLTIHSNYITHICLISKYINPTNHAHWALFLFRFQIPKLLTI